MTHHITVGVVYRNKVVRVFLESGDEFVGYMVCLHLRMAGKCCGIETAWDLNLVFILIWRRCLAVKEAGDMPELLRFGNS